MKRKKPAKVVQKSTVLVRLTTNEAKYLQKVLTNATIIDDNLDDYPEIMTRSQVADCLSVNVQTIDRYVRIGTISKVKDLNVIRFRKSDVINVFKNYSKYQRTVKKTLIND